MNENPRYIELLNEAFEAFLTRDPEAALSLCEEAIKIDPERGEHLFILGIVSLGFNDAGRAVKFMEEGHRREPDWLEFAQALNTLNAEIGNLSDSLYYAKLELVLDSNPVVKEWMPDSFGDFFDSIEKIKIPTYMVNGWVEFHERKYQSAVAFCKRELAINPDNDDCYLLYGRASMELHEYELSIEALEKAIQLNPGHVEHHIYYADALLAAGYAERSVKVCREALVSHPDSLELRNRLICALPYCPDQMWSDSAAEIAELARVLNTECVDQSRIGEGHRPKKLCVGFLINQYALSEFAEFLGPIFQSYDRSKYKFIGYQQYSQPYPGTEIFSKVMDDWVETYDINDPTLAFIIKNDDVDVLVDICGVQPGNRQKLMAGSAYPIRINWLGFPTIAVPTSTDAILCDDASLDQFEKVNSDIFIQSIGESMVTYGGGSASLEISAENPPPLLRNDGITFGATLNLKVIEQSAPLWAEVLKSVEESRLLIGGRGDVFEGTKRRIHAIFDSHGVSQKVQVQDDGEGLASPGAFLSSVDILLDSRLVSGTSMIADALWSGVPVVTIRANRPISCVAASILEAVGRKDWIAKTETEFLEIAKTLAGDKKGLIDIRANLRGQVEKSKLCDTKQFAKNFTQALDKVWAKAKK